MYKLYFFNFLFIIFTVPWFYFKSEIKSILGFPPWALYSILSTFIYAIIIFYFLEKYWDNSDSKNNKNI